MLACGNVSAHFVFEHLYRNRLICRPLRASTYSAPCRRVHNGWAYRFVARSSRKSPLSRDIQSEWTPMRNNWIAALAACIGLGGSGQLRCTDGATATFRFQRLSVFRGYGAGSFSRGGMSFAYGLTADEAGPYVKLPRGKKLTYFGEELT